MKKTSHILKGLTLAVLLTFGITAFAENSNTSEKTSLAEKEIVTDIKSQISFPEFLLESNSTEHQAEVSFKVTNCGFINVVKINTSEEKLKSELQHQLSKIKLNPQGLDENSTYQVVVRFKAL